MLENQGQQTPGHLYVIWSEWGQLTQPECFEIALKAYREAKGSALASSLRVILGLTAMEAGRMGIKHVPLEPAA